MNGFVILVTIVAVFTTSILHANGHEISGDYEVSNERLIHKYLMADYNPSVRPVRNDADAVDLRIDLYIKQIADLDEVNEALQASGWMYLKWNDFQLSWEPEHFGNINKTRVPISKLWVPDVAIFNSLDVDMIKPKKSQSAVVISNGDVMWFPAMNFRTFCALDLTHFPFDEHLCYINVITWTYDEAEVNMTLAMVFGKQIFDNVATTEWEVVRADHKRLSILYACCPNPYIEIQFELLLRRRPTFASHLFIAPSIILCLITPTIFILPPASFEKLTFGSGVLLGHVLLLGELINFIPSAHPTLPLMGRFFLANIVIVSLSLAISVVVLNLWSRSKTRCVGPPSFCRTILLHWVMRTILLINVDDYDEEDLDDAGLSEDSVKSGTSEFTDERARIIDETLRRAAKSDWRHLSVVVDRFFFVIFAVIMIVTCLAFTGYL